MNFKGHFQPQTPCDSMNSHPGLLHIPTQDADEEPVLQNRLRKFLSSAETPLVWKSLELITNRLSNFGSLVLIKLLPRLFQGLQTTSSSQARCAKLIKADDKLARTRKESLRVRNKPSVGAFAAASACGCSGVFGIEPHIGRAPSSH